MVQWCFSECLIMDLYTKLLKIYPNLTENDFLPLGTIVLQDDGQGQYIKSWNNLTYAQPTQAQINAIE